jgi:hypothetical protein
MYAIGALEGVTLLEFEQEQTEEQQAAQEQEVPAGGVNVEDLLECLDHQPSSFLKGKSRSILRLLCFKNGNLNPLCLIR